MRTPIGIALLAVAFSAGCIRLSVDEVGNWKCEADSDCVGGYVCLKESSSHYEGGARCREKGWCEADDQCGADQACVDGKCEAAGGKDGICRDDYDCSDGHICSMSCSADDECATGRCQCVATGDEVCNGIDDDCNGQTDEGFPIGEACTIAGRCSPSRYVCDAQSGLECVAGDEPDRAPTKELCNGIDDDCDGQVDEQLGVITCGDGACRTTVNACENGVAPMCVPKSGSVDICGDDIDNDCDGATDNDKTQWVSTSSESSTDRCSSLTWQKGRSDKIGNLDGSQYCDSLIADGFDDWRLPTSTEYDSLLVECPVDFNEPLEETCTPCRKSPICNALFPSDDGGPYQSQGGKEYYDLAAGLRSGGTTNGYSYARCVRTP